MKRLKIVYPSKRVDGSPEFFTLTYDNGVKESFKIFYCQVEEMSEICVSVEMKQPARLKRPIETKGDKIRKLGIVNRKYYEVLVAYPEIAETYIKKLKYIQLVMGTGKRGNNFLSPAYYICHLKSCLRIITLKSLGNMSSGILRWKYHTCPN